jgi:VanZ family protein
MTSPSSRAPRATTDIPITRQFRPGPDLAALAQRFALPIRVAFLLCVLIATTLQLGFDPSWSNALWRLRTALNPAVGYKDLVDAARNVALFVAWGAVWMLTARAPAAVRSITSATLVGMVASLTVEGIQTFSTVRFASSLDVITNTLGSLIGAVAVWIIEHRAALDMRRGTLLGVPAWMPAGAWLASAFGLAWAPTSRPARFLPWTPTPLERLATARATPDIVGLTSVSAIPDVIVFLLAGALAAIAVCDRAGRVRVPQLVSWALLGAGASVLAQLGRGLSGVTVEPGIVPVQIGAFALGLLVACVAMPRWRTKIPARSTRALHVAIAAVAVGSLVVWWPASWVSTKGGVRLLSVTQLIPMYSLFQRQDLASVLLVLSKGATGAAIGAAVAARKAVGQPVPGFRAVALVALVWELGQFVVPGRYPDITDVLIVACAGGLMAVLGGRAKQGAISGTG